MRLLAACSLGGAGHFNPMIPFLESAQKSGDEILVVGPASIEGLVATAGFPFAGGDDPESSEVTSIREQLVSASREEATILGNRELFGRLATDALLPQMQRTCAKWRPSLVLREPCEYSSAVTAGDLGIPTAQVAISSAAAELGSIAAAAPALERYRMGLPRELKEMAYLTRFPSSMDPTQFPSTIRYREPLTPARPLPDWWNGSHLPLVYVTMGSVFGRLSIAPRIFATILNAVGRIDGVRFLVTFGRALDRSQIAAIPRNVHVEQWIDQTDALAASDAVLCHGGSGTVLGSLARGLPLVVLPFFADQFENGAHVARVGAGLEVRLRSDVESRESSEHDAEQIIDAVNAVLNDGDFRKRAADIARELAARATPDQALEILAHTQGSTALEDQ